MDMGGAVWQPGSPDTIAGGAYICPADIYVVAPNWKTSLDAGNNPGVDPIINPEFPILYEAFVDRNVSKRLEPNPGVALDEYLGSAREVDEWCGNLDRHA